MLLLLNTFLYRTHSNLHDSQATTATADLASEAEDVSEEYEAQEVITTSDPLQKPNPNIDSQNERNSHTNQVAEGQSAVNNTDTNKTLHETVRLVQNKKQKRSTD